MNVTFLALFTLFLCASCISTKRDMGLKMWEKGKFGVVMDSILKDVSAPNFPFFMKGNSSDMEGELTGLHFWRSLDLFFGREVIDLPLNGFFWPTETFVITDSFYVQRYKWKKKNDNNYVLVSYFHAGVDFKVKMDDGRNSAVFAVEEGKIAKVSDHEEYGLYIDIRHKDKYGSEYFTRYAHLSSIYVRKGQKVYKGERIAISGSTGRSRGPHLHFEIFEMENGKKIAYNPILFFPDFRNDISYCLPEKRKMPEKPEIKIDLADAMIGESESVRSNSDDNLEGFDIASAIEKLRSEL